MTPNHRIRIGISSCLLGRAVRYDGGHKHDRWITDSLGAHLEFVPVCPELAIGLGVPRPPIRLVGKTGSPRAVGVADSSIDVTNKLSEFGVRTAHELADISGYILKSRSPSCGMERVNVYPPNGGPAAKSGRGIFASALMAARPELPVEEEGRLGDPDLRENFLNRVFAYHRWQILCQEGITASRLVEFHTIHKLLIMAHGDEHYRALGRLVAGSNRKSARDIAPRYVARFMEALSHRATRAKQANVLMHIMGYLKKSLDRGDKAELLSIIHGYRRGQMPLIVPMTLLRHHFRRHPSPYVAGQVYLQPGLGDALAG